MAETHADQAFIEYVLKLICTNPQAVKVERTIDELGVLITVEIAKEDMGTVIGKNGQTAKSLRTLLRVIGAKENARVNMKIVEPEGSAVTTSDEE
jgi:uncharacterized protein